MNAPNHYDTTGKRVGDDRSLDPTSRRARALTTAADDTPRTPDEIAAHCVEVLRLLNETRPQVLGVFLFTTSRGLRRPRLLLLSCCAEPPTSSA